MTEPPSVNTFQIRNPKQIGDPNSEELHPCQELPKLVRISVLGFRISFGLRRLGFSLYFTCPNTSFVISNMLTRSLPSKTCLSWSSALMKVLFSGSCRLWLRI